MQGNVSLSSVSHSAKLSNLRRGSWELQRVASWSDVQEIIWLVFGVWSEGTLVGMEFLTCGIWCYPQVCVCVHVCVRACMRVLARMLVTQSCLILCHPMDCSPPSSCVYGILQARILEWVAILFSMVDYIRTELHFRTSSWCLLGIKELPGIGEKNSSMFGGQK